MSTIISLTFDLWPFVSYRKPVSMKQTKHSRKSEAQNLCEKCPPFTRTHAFKRLRQCAIADGFGGSVQLWCYAAALLGTRAVNGDNYRNTVLLSMLLPDIRSVFGDYYLFSARWGTSTSCTWHCHHAAKRETLEFIPPEMWPPNSPDLNPVDYSSFKRGSTARGSMMWRSCKNVCWGSGGCWTTPS